MVLAWIIFGVFLWLVNKTKAGHALIYYSLVLMLFFLLVTQYQWIATNLRPISGIKG